METETFEVHATEAEVCALIETYPASEWMDEKIRLFLWSPVVRCDSRNPRRLVISLNAIGGGETWEAMRPIQDAIRIELTPTDFGTRIEAQTIFPPGTGQVHFRTILTAVRREFSDRPAATGQPDVPVRQDHPEKRDRFDQVKTLWGMGYTDEEIAEKLETSVSTVKRDRLAMGLKSK